MSNSMQQLVVSRVTDARDMRAIQLKFEGTKYEDIAKALGVSTRAVENWFYSNGRLFDAYREYEEDMANFQKQEAMKLISKSQTISVKALLHILTTGKKKYDDNGKLISLTYTEPAAARVAAAKELLERGFGKAVQPTADLTKQPSQIVLQQFDGLDNNSV